MILKTLNKAEYFKTNESYDLELLVQVAARDYHEAHGVKVVLTGRFILNIGQTLSCECEA